MRRKVVKHGSATLTVSLPSKWAKRFGINPGDELDVLENNRVLTVSTDKNYALERATIEIDQLGLFNKNFISNVYQMGYDEIRINYDTIQTLEHIQKRLQDCIGFEIIDQGERYCIVKSIATISDTEFDKVLSRTFLILLAMSRDCLDATRRQQYPRLKELRVMEAANNKLTDYCRRILNKKGHPDPKMTTVLYSLVHDLEKVADEYKHLCDLLADHTKPLSKEVLELFAEVHDYLETYYHLYYKFDSEKTKKLFTNGKPMVQRAYDLFDKKPAIEVKTLHHLINLTTKIYELTLPYFQMRF